MKRKAAIGFQANPGYDQLMHGRAWKQPSGEKFLLACCDCGIVHEVTVGARGGDPVRIKFARAQSATQSLRRQRK